MKPAGHVKLTAIAAERVPSAAFMAADEAHAAGGSPRTQLDAARKASGQALVYRPHQGSKERLKRLKRMERE